MPFPGLAERVREVRQRIDDAAVRGGHGQTVRIIAVTKTYGPDAVSAAVEAGVEDIGENRVHEALGKMDATSVAVRWHLIGHLQRNKAKAAARFDVVHSLDSMTLAAALNRVGQANGRRIIVFAQVNVAGERTKGGFTLVEMPAIADQLAGLEALEVRGVMTIAPMNADDAALRGVFQGAQAAACLFRTAGHPATELSMGMSNDFEVAVEEGATYVRLGTVLFGARPL
ncbi:MAG TPA: YggS family pyridoxal phosphate-dependent enzyme [Gemmatimonadaceae bacterium]|nr:YggS family pyridoxal phosphate-dependent enzyme [Gemmatimonadaceae bacterium]